jgi:uncharacterized protein
LPLRFEARLELAASEAELLAADDDVDRMVAGREMNVAVLVEDEVILALPMVPKHAQCRAAAETKGGAKPSAFQALAALKKLNR